VSICGRMADGPPAAVHSWQVLGGVVSWWRVSSRLADSKTIPRGIPDACLT
jgi:hypothetical protein